MTNEEVLWEDFERTIKDGYYRPFTVYEDNAALLPLVDRMNKFLLLMQNRLNTTVDILREMDVLKDVVVSLREPGKISVRFDDGNQTNGILIFADRTITSTTGWQEKKITDGQEIRIDRATLTACDFNLKQLFDVHLTRMREEAEALKNLSRSAARFTTAGQYPRRLYDYQQPISQRHPLGLGG